MPAPSVDNMCEQVTISVAQCFSRITAFFETTTFSRRHFFFLALMSVLQ